MKLHHFLYLPFTIILLMILALLRVLFNILYKATAYYKLYDIKDGINNFGMWVVKYSGINNTKTYHIIGSLLLNLMVMNFTVQINHSSDTIVLGLKSPSISITLDGASVINQINVGDDIYIKQ